MMAFDRYIFAALRWLLRLVGGAALGTLHGGRPGRARRWIRLWLVVTVTWYLVNHLLLAAALAAGVAAWAWWRRRHAPPRKVFGTRGLLGLRRVGVGIRDATYHAHVLGPTGTGKTTMLVGLVVDDLAAGRAVVLIDPKGDLASGVLERVPAGVAVAIIDPRDEEYAVGVNPLTGGDADLAAEHIVAVLRRLFAASWGARLEDLARCSVQTLARMKGTTLLDVGRLLTDPAFRARAVEALGAEGSYESVQLLQFWAEVDRLARRPSWPNEVRPLTYKLRSFVPSAIRPIVAQPEPKGDPLSLVDRGGLVVVRAVPAEIGEDPARLLGALVIARFADRILARARRPEHARPHVSLVVDEAQEFVSDARILRRLLEQARSMGAAVVLAHQHLGQLPSELAAAVAANTTTKSAFRLRADDAKAFARDLAVEAAALEGLPRHTVVVRPCVGGVPGYPEIARTRAPRPGSPGRSKEAVKASREAWGRPRADVLAALMAGHQSASAERATRTPTPAEAVTSQNALQTPLRKEPLANPPQTPPANPPQTPRDVAVLEALREHGVLTASHVAAVGFPSEQAARNRLSVLAGRGLVASSRGAGVPPPPARWVLTPAGGRLLGDEGWRTPDLDESALPHRLAVADVAAAAVRALRGAGHEGRWLGERTARGMWGGTIVPDAVIDVGGRLLPLELDRGTEPWSELEGKLARYADLAPSSPVLLVLAGARRKAPHTGPPGWWATLPDVLGSPLGAVWTSLRDGGRSTLLQLAGLGGADVIPLRREIHG